MAGLPTESQQDRVLLIRQIMLLSIGCFSWSLHWRHTQQRYIRMTWFCSGTGLGHGFPASFQFRVHFSLSHSSVCRPQPFLGCGLWLMTSIWDVVVALKTFVSFLSFKLIFPCCLNFLGAICFLVYFADAKAGVLLNCWFCLIEVVIICEMDLWLPYCSLIPGCTIFSGLWIPLPFIYIWDFTGREFVHLVAVCWGSA